MADEIDLDLRVEWGGSFTVWAWLRAAMLQKSLLAGKCVYEARMHGYSEDSLHDLFGLVGGAVLLNETDTEITFRVEEGFAYFEKLPGESVTAWVASTNQRIVEETEKRMKSRIRITPPKGQLFVLTRTPAGLSLTSVGQVNAPLERRNYAPEVIKKYDHLVACLRSDAPCGRLVLLDGPPGTGKSYIIRALAGEVRAMFVVVASSMIGYLAGPDVIPALLNSRCERSNAAREPIVLVLEDADAALIQRERGDHEQLSNILNIGDGLLGELADLRIIATTNAKRIELDSAILRPGRMCSHVQIDVLSNEVAGEVYERLTGKKLRAIEAMEMTIAEVYRRARRDGWEPVHPPRPPGQYV